MNLVGGHPYLVGLALYHIARSDITLAQLLETGASGNGIYNDHLQNLWWNLQQEPELASRYAKIARLQSPVPLKLKPALKLQRMGLVKPIDNYAIPSCELYRQYFGDRLHARSLLISIWTDFLHFVIY